MGTTSSPTATPDTTSRLGEDRFRLFSVCWAAATLFHLASYDKWTSTPLASLTGLAAVALLLKPRSSLLLVCLAIVQICEVYGALPFVSNHWFLTMLVNATILTSGALLLVREKRARVGGSAFLASFAPAIRVELLAFYFFTVFHKLNTSFLDPSVSCGAQFYTRQVEVMTFLPTVRWAVMASIGITLLIEAAIPIMLLVQSWRVAGILAALVFHGLVALNPQSGFYNFSSMIAAVLVLFLPEDHASRVVAQFRRVPRIGAVFRRATRIMNEHPWWSGAGIGLAVVSMQSLDLGGDPFVIVWIAWVAALLAALTRAALRPTTADPSVSFRLRRLEWCVPALVILNGAAPYLGLKTETAFAMYSNLRTEAGLTNHLLVPADLHPFRYQDDLIEVTGSSDRFLRDAASRRQLLPSFEVWRRPSASIAYRLDGREVRWRRVADDPRYPGPAPLLAAKLLSFRPVDPGRVQRCQH
jgi:hypothetical protein